MVLFPADTVCEDGEADRLKSGPGVVTLTLSMVAAHKVPAT